MVGALECSGVNNKFHSDEVDALLRDIEELAKVTFTKDGVANLKTVAAWKEGARGEKFYSNIEEMLTKVISGQEIESKNKLTNLCNFIALKYMLNCNVIDLAKVNGDNIIFRLAKKGDTFRLLKKEIALEEGELIASDNENVLIMKGEYNTSSAASANNRTKNALIVIEALPPVTADRLKNILEELGDLIKIFCKGKCKSFILDKISIIYE